MLWRGIQMPGHEACRLWQQEASWHLGGAAVFTYEEKPCQLGYHIACNAYWETVFAEVRGWVGNLAIDVHIRVNEQQSWWLNETEVPEVAGNIDLDLNFSPCTNMLPIRRLKLAIGEGKDITPAWLRFPSFTLEPLPQRYQRTGEFCYRYESGGGKFVTNIQVDGEGFVIEYPGIWVAEASI